MVDGSKLDAAKTVKLTTQEGDVTIKESIDTYSENSKDKHASAEVSITVQNEYVEIGSAIKAAAESAKQLKKVKEDYSKYKDEVSKLESTLSDIKTRYKAKEAGIDFEDIGDLQDVIDNVKDTEKYYVAAIAAAAADLASKTVAIASQAATAAASSGTWGFSVGLALDMKGSQLVAENLQTKSLASSIYGNDILIQTNTAKETTTTISGSNVVAENDINIQTHDLMVKSSTDTTSSKQDSKDLSGSLSMTMYGGGSGMGATLGYGEGHQNSDSTTNTNSELLAKNITIETSNDASFKGATVKADDTLNMKVGGDLSVESQRDSSSSNSKGFNVSASASLGGDKDYTSGSKTQQNTLNNTVGARTGSGLGSTGASFGASSGTSQSKQTVLTSLTGDKVNIDVENNTHIKGALIAAGSTNEQGQFEDNGNLNLKTDTLTFANSSNTQFSSSNSFNVGANIGFGTKTNPETKAEESTTNVNSSSLSLSSQMGYSATKTLATVGQGNLEVGDKENSDDLTRLNRDTSKVNKDLYAGSTGTSVTAVLDHRLLTEEGRKQIKQDFATTITEIYAVSQVASAYLSDSSKEILKDKLANKQLTSEQEKQLTNELNALKKIVNEQGYDVDKMTLPEKIATLEKLNAESETLTTVQKQLRDVIWLSGTLLSDDWNTMRKQQIDKVADSSVKSLDFWRTEAKWNEMTQSEKEAFAKSYNDGNNKIIGNTLATQVKITDLDGAGTLNSDGKIIRNTLGDYSQDGSLIRLDKYDTKDFYTVLNVILHEGVGHGYQDYAIKNQTNYVKTHPLQADDIRLLTLAYITKMWPGKEIKYSDDLTYKLYRSDPSEVDAWKVGDTTSVKIQLSKPKETPKAKQ